CVDSAPCLKSHCGHHEGHPHSALRATFSRRREKVSVTVTMLATILDLAGRLSPQVVEIDLGRIVLVLGDRLLGDNDAGAVELAVFLGFLGDVDLAGDMG